MLRPIHIVLMAVLITAGGCSWSAEWVITNGSGESVRVRVDAPRVRSGSSTYCGWQANDVRLPVVIRTSDLDDWRRLGPDSARATVDPIACSVTFVVPPEHSAVIWESRGTTRPSRDDHVFGFPAAIHLAGAEGVVGLAGPHLDELFQIGRGRRFVWTYGRRS